MVTSGMDGVREMFPGSKVVEVFIVVGLCFYNGFTTDSSPLYHDDMLKQVTQVHKPRDASDLMLDTVCYEAPYSYIAICTPECILSLLQFS